MFENSKSTDKALLPPLIPVMVGAATGSGAAYSMVTAPSLPASAYCIPL